MEKNHEKCCPISTIVILRLMILQLTKAVAENISMTSKTITFKILQSTIKLRPSMQLISLYDVENIILLLYDNLKWNIFTFLFYWFTFI